MTEVKALTVVDSINKMEVEFARALPKHIPSERFTRIAVSAVNSNPDLLSQNIDRRSLYASVMKAAQDGLVLDNREAAIITFTTKDGVKAQYLPMVAGVIKKMRNSGEIANISYGLVYQKEYEQGKFKYVKGDNESLEHTPILFEEKGDMIGVYAVVTLKDGTKVREFMDMKQLAKVRASSRSKNGPWATWFEEMSVKSVLKKVSKLCPSSSDLDAVFKSIDGDDDFEGETIESTSQPTTETPKRSRKTAAEKVKEHAAATPEPLDNTPHNPTTGEIIEDAEIVEEEIPV